MSYHDMTNMGVIWSWLLITLDNKKYLCVFEVMQQQQQHQQQVLFINVVKNRQESNPPIIGDT